MLWSNRESNSDQLLQIKRVKKQWSVAYICVRLQENHVNREILIWEKKKPRTQKKRTEVVQLKVNQISDL